MAQAFCHVCYGTSLTFENGVLVCDICGTQTQTFQEEAEFQAGIDDTRGKRRAAGSSTAGQQSQATLLAREEELAAQQLQDAALAYVRCLQHLLQAQAEVLTTRFGVSAQVVTVLRQVWLSHLPTTGMLEPTPHQPPAAALAAATAGLGQDGTEADADDMDAVNGEDDETEAGQLQRSAVLVLPKNMKHLFWKLLHPQVTLQLCYLSCALLREAVTFYDVISWALDGQLPFLDLPDLASKCLPESELAVLPVRCIQPEVSLSPIAFYNGCCQLAEQLGLQLPYVAGEALLLRTVEELGLPKVVLDVCLQLYFMYLLQSSRMRLAAITRAAHSTPYVWLSAAVLVAVKLLYGLGNAAGSMPLAAKAPPPPGGWQAWAQAVIQHLPGITSMPLTEDEVLAFGPEARQQYLQYCRQHMFAGQPTVPTFEDIQRILLGWYDATVAQDSTPGATVPTNAPAAQRASQSQAAEPTPAPQSGLGQPFEAGFAVDTSNYSLLLLGSSAAAGSYRLEPQLAAVVLAVAAYSRCSPTALLDCVRVIEKQMLSVEAGVKLLRHSPGVSL